MPDSLSREDLMKLNFWDMVGGYFGLLGICIVAGYLIMWLF
jgi:hypothetical protein